VKAEYREFDDDKFTDELVRSALKRKAEFDAAGTIVRKIQSIYS
jgi:hypothetical protein